MRRVLNVIESAKLVHFILMKYQESHLTDKQFAALSSTELGFECTPVQVALRRKELKIESYLERGGNIPRTTVALRMKEYDEVLTTILTRLNALEAAIVKKSRKA